MKIAQDGLTCPGLQPLRPPPPTDGPGGLPGQEASLPGPPLLTEMGNTCHTHPRGSGRS